jgi:hypothetical protein
VGKDPFDDPAALLLGVTAFQASKINGIDID